MNLRTFLLAAVMCLAAATAPAQSAKVYYVIRVYSLAGQQQEAKVDKFLKDVYVPALHRNGIASVGIFKPVETDTVSFGKKIYVIFDIASLQMLENLDVKLSAGKEYESSEYWSATYDQAPYLRSETIICRSFTKANHLTAPHLNGPKTDRVYELRSYESPTEKIFANKVHMFVQGDEIGLFSRLGFNALFYSEVIAGAHMPNLMYMTSFDNRTARDAHWKTFVDDPEWKRLSTMPEYQHNVSKIEIFLLHPTEYSDL